MKICFKCKLIKDLDEFYKHPEMRDGHLGKCKDCCKLDTTLNRKNKSEYYKKYNKERALLPHSVEKRKIYQENHPEKIKEIKRKWVMNNKEKIYASTSKYRSNNKDKRIAHGRLYYAVSTGKIIKHICKQCGVEKAQAHHEDYSKPLDVIWLCSACHAKWHKEKRREIS